MSLHGSHTSVFFDIKNGAHMLSGDVLTMVQSADFEIAMLNAANNADTKAFLTIQALQEIALNPLRGNTPADYYIDTGEYLCFNVHFDRWSNFIGYFELPAVSGRAKQMIDAITQNLASKMFEAALETRRLDRVMSQTLEPVRELARKASWSVLQSTPIAERDETLRQIARDAYARVMKSAEDAWQKEYRAVASVAAPGFQGSYTEAVAGFLYRHLPFTGITH